MPLIREAVRAFEGYVSSLDGAARAVEAGRAAVSAERARLLDAAAARFSDRLRAEAPDADAVVALDRRHGLGMDPGSALQALAHARDAAIQDLTVLEDSQARAAALAEALRLTADDAAREARAAARMARDAADGLAGFDAGFLAVHAAVAPANGPAMQDGAMRAPGFLSTLFDERLRAARGALAGYRDGEGRDYFAVRDGSYLPLVAERGRLDERAALLRGEAIGARQALLRREQANLRGGAAVEAARAALTRAEEELARPEETLMRAARAWFTGHVEAFEAQAALRDPRAAESFEGLSRAGLVDGADLAGLGHRFVLGQVERGLIERRDAIEAMLGRLEPALERLHTGLERGMGASYVEMDLSVTEASVGEAVAGATAALRNAEDLGTRRAAEAATARGRSDAVPRQAGALVWWMLATAAGRDAGAARAAAAAAATPGAGDPMVAAGLGEALAPDLEAAEAGLLDGGIPIPDFELPRPELAEADYGDVPAPALPAGF